MGNREITTDDFNKVYKYVYNKRRQSLIIDDLFSELGKRGNIIIIGGAVRDLIISDCEPRDIDLIIDTDIKLDFLLDKFKNVSKNRFGGYKLNLNGLEFDIWSINDHWAFKQEILEKSFKNIEHSTFLNFDSLFINLTTRKGCIDIFNKCILDKFLDITLPEKYIYMNPSVEINILRMFVIEQHWNLTFSENIDNYILSWLKNQRNPVESLWEAQKKHYKHNIKINKKVIETKLNKYFLD